MSVTPPGGPEVALTYPEAGASRAEPLPPGYHHVRRRVRLGTGEPVFQAAAEALGRWQAQRGAGLVVDSPRPEVGLTVRLGIGIGRWRIWAPTRIVWVLDEPGRYGLGYGTLPGHPASGEEAFVVSTEPDGSVWFDIRAFSRPARWFFRLGGPVARLVQSRVTDRYVAVIEAAARTAG